MKDTVLENQTIKENLYIGLDAHVILKNVRTTGNVYVYGTLESKGNVMVENMIRAKRVVREATTVQREQGTAYFVKGDQVEVDIETTTIIPRMPLQIYGKPLIPVDGKVSFTGATLPVLQATIDGKPLALQPDGTFSVQNYDIVGKKGIEIILTDIFGQQSRQRLGIMDQSNPEVEASMPTGFRRRRRKPRSITRWTALNRRKIAQSITNVIRFYWTGRHNFVIWQSMHLVFAQTSMNSSTIITMSIRFR